MSENEKKYAKENNIDIKTIKNMNRTSEHCNKLLSGFQEKETAIQDSAL